MQKNKIIEYIKNVRSTLTKLSVVIGASFLFCLLIYSFMEIKDEQTNFLFLFSLVFLVAVNFYVLYKLFQLLNEIILLDEKVLDGKKVFIMDLSNPKNLEGPILLHCISILCQKEKEDKKLSAYWNIKRNVAEKCYRLWLSHQAMKPELYEFTDDLEDKILDSNPLLGKYELSDDVKNEISKNHPLLCRFEDKEMHELIDLHSKWFEEIKLKVNSYIKKRA